MATKNSNAASPVLLAFQCARVVKICEDGSSRGVTYDRNGKIVTFTTPKGTTSDFSKEDVFDILLKSMKSV